MEDVGEQEILSREVRWLKEEGNLATSASRVGRREARIARAHL